MAMVACEEILPKNMFNGFEIIREEERLCMQCRRSRFDLWVGKIPWRRGQLPTLFLPGESQGQRCLAGYWVAQSWTRLTTKHQARSFCPCLLYFPFPWLGALFISVSLGISVNFYSDIFHFFHYRKLEIALNMQPRLFATTTIFHVERNCTRSKQQEIRP